MPGVLEDGPVMRKRPQRTVAAAEACNLHALLDDPVKGNLGRKPLFPLQPRVASHLDRSIRILLQYLRQARRICFGDAEGAGVPVDAVVGGPIIGEDNAGAAHFHRLIEPDAVDRLAARAKGEAGVCDGVRIVGPESGALRRLAVIHHVEANGGGIGYVDVVALEREECATHRVRLARADKRRQIFLLSGRRAVINIGILDQDEIEPGPGMIGTIKILAKRGVDAGQNRVSEVPEAVEQKTLAAKAAVVRVRAHSFLERAAFSHFSKQNQLGFFGVFHQPVLPECVYFRAVLEQEVCAVLPGVEGKWRRAGNQLHKGHMVLRYHNSGGQPMTARAQPASALLQKKCAAAFP